MTTIAFIGLGHMGGPMAANLVKAGHRVHGYDIVAASREAAAANGVAIAASAAEAVAASEVVITMLPAGKHVVAVWKEILPAARAGTLFIDSSTIDVESARRAHAMAHEAGMDAVDAPVSGGVGGAQAATLTFMAGGTDGAFARAKPILEAMGKRIVHCGPAGNGQAAKICNNMILGISMIGVCEAFALAEKLGLSHQALFDVASTSSGQSAELMLKDLRLSQDAALASGAATPLGAAAAQLYALYAGAGHGGEDFSGIIHFLRGLAGVSSTKA